MTLMKFLAQFAMPKTTTAKPSAMGKNNLVPGETEDRIEFVDFTGVS